MFLNTAAEVFYCCACLLLISLDFGVLMRCVRNSGTLEYQTNGKRNWFVVIETSTCTNQQDELI